MTSQLTDLWVCAQITWKDIKMIKLVLFDLDGVLIKAKDIHYRALNRALGEYAISKEEHLGRYDGLPTKVKLKMVVEDKGLPESRCDEVWERKQTLTLEMFGEELGPDEQLIDVFQHLVTWIGKSSDSCIPQCQRFSFSQNHVLLAFFQPRLQTIEYERVDLVGLQSF